MRAEKRNKIFIIMMTGFLGFLVVAIQIRLHLAAPMVPPCDFIRNGTLISPAGAAGTISTSDGEVVFDGKNTAYPEFYVIIGNVKGGKHQSEFTLGFKYKQRLIDSSLTVLGGMHTYKGISGSKMVTTLLPGSAQQKLHEAFGDYHGSLFAYNYVTGEIYSMLSLPSGQDRLADDGQLTNRILDPHTPGSTMKVVTLICALTQNPELAHFTYTCTASHALPSGSVVTCDYKHGGPQSMSEALANSCNCYFAALIAQLDVRDTSKTLDSLGFNTSKMASRTYSIDKVNYRGGYVNFENNTAFDSVWNLIGQNSMASMIDMARIAGAVANGGSSAMPYMIESIYDPNKEEYTHQATPSNMKDLVDTDVASTLKPMWSSAVEEAYRDRKIPLDARITLAKTGTSEHEDMKTHEAFNCRLMMGVLEEYNTAFVLRVEHLPAGDSRIFSIANTLAAVLAESDLG